MDRHVGDVMFLISVVRERQKAQLSINTAPQILYKFWIIMEILLISPSPLFEVVVPKTLYCRIGLVILCSKTSNIIYFSFEIIGIFIFMFRPQNSLKGSQAYILLRITFYTIVVYNAFQNISHWRDVRIFVL